MVETQPLKLSEENRQKLAAMSFTEMAVALEESRNRIIWSNRWPEASGVYLVGQMEASGCSRVLEAEFKKGGPDINLAPCLLSGPYTEKDRQELWYQMATISDSSRMKHGTVKQEHMGKWPSF